MGQWNSHNKESILWLEENMKTKTYTNKQLAEMFSSLFRPISAAGIRKIAQRYGIYDRVGKKPNGDKHSQEGVEWARQMYKSKKYTIKEMTNMYSQKFRPVTEGAFRHLLRDHGIWENNGKYLPFTNEQIKWLLDNYEQYPNWSATAKAFTEKFSRKVSGDTLSHRMLKIHGIVREENIRFTLKYSTDEIEWIKENINILPTQEFIPAFNKNFPSHPITNSMLQMELGRLGIKRSKDVVSKTRSIALSEYRGVSLGTERRNTLGVLMVKTNNKRGVCNWTYKKVLEWESINGPLPKGYRVICLDGNEDNFSADNLYAVPYKGVGASLHVFKQHHPWVKTIGADWTKAYLMTQELRYALKDKGVKV